jgi:hypothetical protein
MKEIKEKDKCWICHRTKKQVVEDSHPDGELLFLNGTKQDLIDSAFIKNEYNPGSTNYPICVVCHHFIAMISLYACDKQHILDEIGDSISAEIKIN